MYLNSTHHDGLFDQGRGLVDLENTVMFVALYKRAAPPPSNNGKLLPGVMQRVAKVDRVVTPSDPCGLEGLGSIGQQHV